MRGLVVSAPASGAGKTTLTLGLIAALRARGLTVQPFKSGPDYIDPAFHARAAGRESLNLDSWAMDARQIAHWIAAAAAAGGGGGSGGGWAGSGGSGSGRSGGGGARADVRPPGMPDLAVVEGSMGLFDGVATRGGAGTGASADIAALTGWPVVLVLDCRGQAQTAAAVALGCMRMRPEVTLAGVVLNRVASARHEGLMRRAFDALGIAVLGALPRDAAIALPERHLGLVQAQEHDALDALLARAGEIVARHLDLDAVIAAAAPWRGGSAGGGAFRPVPPPAPRIALARDAAFSFVYPHLIAGWRAAGATILPFSPLADEAPDDSAGACWLPGGYPELHAGRLAAAGRFREGLARFALTRPVHGECGGYMAMGAGLVDAQGVRHRMAGLLGLETSHQQRRMHLGYRRAVPLAGPGGGLAAGAITGALAGHEFHYATILAQPDAALALVTDAEGTPVAETGSRRGLASGTFFHLIGAAP